MKTWTFIERTANNSDPAKPQDHTWYDIIQDDDNGGPFSHVASAGRLDQARLLAAAPRLLKELKELVARCDGQEGIQPDGSNMETRSAHMAILAAEGED